MPQVIPSPAPSANIGRSNLRVVRDEESQRYDAAFAAASERPAPGFGMIPACVYALNNGYAIAVYAALARHADRSGQCWPSHALLCQTTGWSKPTVIKALNVLKAAGVIDWDTRKSADGDLDTNLYTLHFHRGGSKGRCLPPSKGDCLGVVNDVDYGSKGRLHEQDSVNIDPIEQETIPTESAAQPPAARSLWETFVTNYRTYTNKVSAVGEFYAQVMGKPPDYPRLGLLLKQAGSGEVMGRAILDASAHVHTDDPLDYLQAVIQRRRTSRNGKNADAGPSLSEEEISNFFWPNGKQPDGDVIDVKGTVR